MRYFDLAPDMPGVSRLFLGTADFGAAISSPDAFALMDQYVEQGGNLLDTAHVYGRWIPGAGSLSEETIGQWLKRRGGTRGVWVATKGGHPQLGKSPMGPPRLDRAGILADLDESLRHLGVERIDLYYLHRDDRSRPVEQIMDTLLSARRAGKIGHLGASNWQSDRLAAANAYAASQGSTGFVACQNLYNAAVANPEAPKDETLVTMTDEDLASYADGGITPVAFTSQARGYFTKMHQSGPEGLSPATLTMYDGPVNRGRLAAMEKIAAQTGLTVSQIVLGYLTGKGVTPIIGCRNSAQLNDSLTAADVALTAGQIAAIDAIR
jgi:aryl-alcohol dehydrogenase-like predicted oxidoreductase